MAKTRKKKPTINYILIFAIGILAIGALLYANLLLNPAAPVETLAQATEERIIEKDADVPRVRLQEAKMAYDTNSAIFIDVRSRDSFNFAHIPGALSIEIPEIREMTAGLDPEALIITYCT